MATVQDAVRRCLAQLSHELAGCLLYLDAGSAEAVATGVGAAALQGAHVSVSQGSSWCLQSVPRSTWHLLTGC